MHSPFRSGRTNRVVATCLCACATRGVYAATRYTAGGPRANPKGKSRQRGLQHTRRILRATRNMTSVDLLKKVSINMVYWAVCVYLRDTRTREEA